MLVMKPWPSVDPMTRHARSCGALGFFLALATAGCGSSSSDRAGTGGAGNVPGTGGSSAPSASGGFPGTAGSFGNGGGSGEGSLPANGGNTGALGSANGGGRTDAGSSTEGGSSTHDAKGCSGRKHTPGGPDSAAGCWPGVDNTGVPAGTTLTAYTGPCTVTANNTVIDAKTVHCDLAIKAANVQIIRSKIIGSVSTDENSTGYSFSISDSEVDIGDRDGTGVGAVNFTATRVHVHGGNRSMNCWHDCTVTDSYVHGQFTDPSGTFHESGMRMGQSATFRHNSVICDAPDVPPDGGCSADLTGYGDFGPVQNNTIDRNLFGATTGGFCTYGGSSKGKPYSNDANHIIFTGNVWQRGTRLGDHGAPVCGYYGSNTSFDPARPGNVWTHNEFDDGTAVPSAN
jgi:hypothetical protein